MTVKEIYEKAEWELNHNKITIGEFEKLVNIEVDEVLPDYIEDEKVRHYCNGIVTMNEKTYHKLQLRNAPKQGEWIEDYNNTYSRCRMKCSACGKFSGIGGIKSNQRKPYCPNCGAKMKGEI